MSVAATAAVFTFALLAFLVGVFTAAVIWHDLAVEFHKERPHR